MATRFGIENLWDVDGHLEEFRRDRSQFIDVVETWKAEAASCVGDFDYDFRQPHSTFSTLTEWIAIAATELLQKSIPQMKAFADQCAAKGENHNQQSPSPPKVKLPILVSISTALLNRTWTEDDYFTGHLPENLPCAPSPKALRQAISEADELIDDLLALPPATVPAKNSQVKPQQAKNQGVATDKAVDEKTLDKLRAAIKELGRKAKVESVIELAKVRIQTARRGLRSLQKQGEFDWLLP